jgi:hypothetical protein
MTSNMGFVLMISDDDAHAIVRTLHLIAVRCFDISAVGRLRWLADQIEEKIQTPNAVQTKPRAPGDQDATPSSNSATREG